MLISDLSSDVCSSDIPCISAFDALSLRKASKTCARAIVAASAMVPPVSALESVTMSGTIPAASKANIVQVRPKPTSEDRRVGKEEVSKCKYRWAQQH